jgi:DNA repair exonuclease SbcCD ATPase subunit
MMSRREYIQQCSSFIKSAISSRNNMVRDIQTKETELNKLKSAGVSLEEAKHIISAEIANIQSSLKEDIDSLVTIALNIVYEGRDIQFAMLFDKSKSGASQYKPVIIENNEEFSPKDEQCGGALDVISYALRIILHSFEKPKGRDFLFFDEPFKFLGGGVMGELAADMAKKVNSDLGIQSVIISHDEISLSKADKVYHIHHNGKQSISSLVGAEESEEKIERLI